jgi:hypothetical protein
MARRQVKVVSINEVDAVYQRLKRLVLRADPGERA